VLAWVAGAAFGVGAGAWIAVRDSPPAYIENWQIGAEGERKTARALSDLQPSEWSVVHDVQCRRGNYDHIIVGRAGVFLLDSKNPQGVVHMQDGVPHLRRPSDPEADSPCRSMRVGALAGAASLHEDLKLLTGRREWVQAVVVLWSEFDEGVYEGEKCALVQGRRLCEWISSRPTVLDEETAAALAAAVQTLDSETPERAQSGVA
jgi:hypothetical protein